MKKGVSEITEVKGRGHTLTIDSGWREVAAWEATRNATGRGVDWRFTTEDARIKLKHLYPVIQG